MTSPGSLEARGLPGVLTASSINHSVVAQVAGAAWQQGQPRCGSTQSAAFHHGLKPVAIRGEPRRGSADSGASLPVEAEEIEELLQL